jgi:hypothetical protein
MIWSVSMFSIGRRTTRPVNAVIGCISVGRFEI